MTTRIALEGLLFQDNPRPINEDAVASLQASIQAIGLLQPILVKPAEINSLGKPGYRLIAGAHRVAAARNLGWTEIEARVIEGLRYLETELIEIDENLIRAELSPAQRAAAIKRRREIWEALHPENSSGTNCSTGIGYGKPPPRPQQFAADTAQAAGMTKQDINRHLSRADALGPDLAAVAGTSLDKGVELDALKAMPPEQRAPLIARAQAGEPVSARRPAARISLSIEYYDVQDGASSLAFSIIRRDPALAKALMHELQHQLIEAA